ncbi:hypothetical protein CDAR_40541 [Caerostris darwini]|uniref:Uncharacterized protein n=1 Tax=Caerostris darwini TaxID=1538125 RepID=A0AAV4RDC5_9ARAC|nr:hypothetical protein CDAR_40541 [Caerostris darwini]
MQESWCSPLCGVYLIGFRNAQHKFCKAVQRQSSRALPVVLRLPDAPVLSSIFRKNISVNRCLDCYLRSIRYATADLKRAAFKDVGIKTPDTTDYISLLINRAAVIYNTTTDKNELIRAIWEAANKLLAFSCQTLTGAWILTLE